MKSPPGWCQQHFSWSRTAWLLGTSMFCQLLSACCSASVRSGGEAAGCSAQVETSWSCSRAPTGSEARGERREMEKVTPQMKPWTAHSLPIQQPGWRWRRTARRGCGRWEERHPQKLVQKSEMFRKLSKDACQIRERMNQNHDKSSQHRLLRQVNW